MHRADSLESVVKGLDDYKPVGNVAVTFGFDKAVLTKEDRAELDGFAEQIASAKGFILEVTGGTDSTGPAQYNYESEPAARRCGGAVPGVKVRNTRAPVLSDRHRQG